MPEILVLADPTTADVFRLSGVDVRPVREAEPAERLLGEALAQGYAVVLVAEGVAAGIQDAIRAAQGQEGPIVVVIPGVGTAGLLGRALLARLRQDVVGT